MGDLPERVVDWTGDEAATQGGTQRLWRSVAVGLTLFLLVMELGICFSPIASILSEEGADLLVAGACSPVGFGTVLSALTLALLLRFPKLGIVGIEPRPNIALISADRDAMILFQWWNRLVTSVMVFLAVFLALRSYNDIASVNWFVQLSIMRSGLKLVQTMHRFIIRNMVIKGIRRYLETKRGFVTDVDGRRARSRSRHRDPDTGVSPADVYEWTRAIPVGRQRSPPMPTEAEVAVEMKKLMK